MNYTTRNLEGLHESKVFNDGFLATKWASSLPKSNHTWCVVDGVTLEFLHSIGTFIVRDQKRELACNYQRPLTAGGYASALKVNNNQLEYEYKYESCSDCGSSRTLTASQYIPLEILFTLLGDHGYEVKMKEKTIEDLKIQ